MTTHPTAGSTASNQFGTFAVHNATEKQVAFVRNLFDSRSPESADAETRVELNGIYDQVVTGQVSKKAASRAIDLLLALPEVSAPAAAPAARRTHPAASDKQVAYVRSLLGERDTTGTCYAGEMWTTGFVAEDGTVHYAYNNLTRSTASEVIDHLRALPRRVVEVAPATEPETGMYVVGDVVYKVYKAVHGSGRQVVKILDVVTDAEGVESATFRYLGLAATNLPSDAVVLDRERAAELGRIYGVCVRCGATLTDEASIERGMGPTCAGAFA